MDTSSPSLSAALSHRMNYLADRQGVLSGNIANADTPGYLARDLKFQPYLQKAAGNLSMRATDGSHMHGTAGGGATGKLNDSARFIEYNGNAVRLDDQLVKMNKTQLDYRMMTQIYAKNAQLQRLAIGRGQ